MTEIITRERWKARFINRIMDRGDADGSIGLAEFEALEESGMLDYSDTPEDSADECLTEWSE